MMIGGGTVRLTNVSLIRGVAIFGIVLLHSKWVFNDINSAIDKVLSLGNLGCQAFFMLSSYCLCESYRHKDFQFSPFLKKRFFSIAPSYWMMIVLNIFLSVVCQLVFGHNMMPLELSLKNIIMNVFLVHGLTMSIGPMNYVVMGGWFIGALMVLYLLFPFFYKAYFLGGMLWQKYRRYVFPLVFAAIVSVIMVYTGRDQESYCKFASSKYFLFINQLTPFAIGFSLFDIIHDERIVNKPLAKFTVCLSITSYLFLTGKTFSFFISPMLSGICTLYLYVALQQVNMLSDKNVFRDFVCKLGDQSNSIYLSHFLIVVFMMSIIKESIGLNIVQNNPTLTYLIVLPFMLVTVYLLSILFNKLFQRFNTCVYKIVKS